MPDNKLYYGDNLDVLRRYVRDESVDLVYLDPPFNSRQDYNVLFAEKDGTRAASQIKAFEDTWEWNLDAEAAYQEIVEKGGRVADAMRAFRTFLSHSDMMAYLAMMAPRLVELKRVLKVTGSIYLHCDPTASHYLKILMDAVFGPQYFLNEITWQRTHSHGNVSRNFGSISDILLAYTKSETYTWNQQYTAFPPDYIAKTFKYSDADERRWQSVTLRNPGPRPNLRYSYKANDGNVYEPHPNGWVCDEKRMRKLDDEGRLHYPTNPEGALRLKMYLDESPGVRLQNIWYDIPAIGSQAQERLGYPTQKPEALLDRIVKTSSNEGDTVLDPFCGCGTAVVAAQRLNRRWLGIDITHLAINLIKQRLRDTFGPDVDKTYEVIGEPASLKDAEQLAGEDPYQFQWWALSLIGARPHEQKKGSDRGIDGRLYFHDDRSGKSKQVIISVKAGHVQVSHVRDLRGVIERENAEIGVLICLEKPTKPMLKEAAEAGFYKTKDWGDFPRLQILTIEDLLSGKTIAKSSGAAEATFKKAPKAKSAAGNMTLPLQ